MYKTILEIDGMACDMCESHVNDTLRKTFAVKKVTSSHKKGQTEVISEQPLEEAALRNALAPTGYKMLAFQQETYEKKGFFRR